MVIMTTKLDAYKQKIAERGLTLLGFDGRTLNLQYDPREDRGASGAVSGDEILHFAINTMTDLPGDGDLFPGINRVNINLGMDL
jgi:hypothetical protein